MPCKRISFFLSVLFACTIGGCDAHDYWALPEPLEVNSAEGILTAQNTESLSQDLFVRYQFDYEVQNLSNEPIEVVVSATSYVNTIERVTGQKVWHLEPNATGQGILTTSQLELGNMLVVRLSCCEASRCTRKEVLCPEQDAWNLDGAQEIATFCYDACKDTTSCILQCPDNTACEKRCNDAVKTISKEDIASCLNHCPNASCQETCRAEYADADEQWSCLSRCPLTCRESCEAALGSAMTPCECPTEEQCQKSCQDKQEDSDACIQQCMATRACQTCKDIQHETLVSCLMTCPADLTCQESCANLQGDAQIQCLSACAEPMTCKTHCEKEIQTECRQQNCDHNGTVATCAHLCIDDPECYIESCDPTPECQETCASLQATCYRNCISTVAQCSDNVQYLPKTDLIPCELCGGKGICRYNIKDEHPTLSTHEDKTGVVYTCHLDCSRYPASCISGCNALYPDDLSRMDCLDMCLNQHLFWCNDYSIPVDYVDANGYQPCCFSDTCHANLMGVVKTYHVECFNDTSCSSGKTCSSEGICVSSGAASCQSTPQNPTPNGIIGLFFVFVGGIYGYRRKFKKI